MISRLDNLFSSRQFPNVENEKDEKDEKLNSDRYCYSIHNPYMVYNEFRIFSK